MTPAADPDRLSCRIETLAGFNDTPGAGVTRFTFSEMDRRARDYLCGEIERAGLAIRTDGIGNIFARLEGSNPDLPPVMSGSHIDSVPRGGKYDGVVGVVCALEALEIIQAEGIVPGRPLELVIFSEEEGPNFGSPLAGSKALTGVYTPEILKTLVNDRGISMYQAAKTAGYDPDSLSAHPMKPGDVHAMIEVHVEQSIVLDSEGISLGVVTGIAGMRWVKVTLQGQPNHAGATPMNYRHDPMAGAAELISAAERTAHEAGPTAVATAGKILCDPNVPNVIPASVELSLDLRDVNREKMDWMLERLEAETEKICNRRGLEYDWSVAGRTEPSACSPRIMDALKDAAKDRGIECMEMTSGALHDTAVLAALTEIGMLFVPSIGGRSHVPEENTSICDIANAANVLTDALIRLST